jgi:hypothetical protein
MPFCSRSYWHFAIGSIRNKSEPDVLINLNLLMLSEKAGSILLEQNLGA